MSIPGPECPACLERLRVDALDGCGLNGPARKSLGDRIAAVIAEGLGAGTAPALVATRFLALASLETGVADPFAALKAQGFAEGRRAFAALDPVPDDFAARCRAAVVGNAADHPCVAQAGALWRPGARLTLAIDDLAAAEARLGPGARVVILADNCGEQCFDRLLCGHLMDRGCRVTYVVKSGPVQNDLTMGDLVAAGEDHGLGELAETGTAQVGLDPGGVAAHLAELLHAADLVIAKGMGHYETLRGLAQASPWPLLLLFVAKCGPVARSLGVEPGQGVARFVPRAARAVSLGLPI